jgi:hypothetical protein
MHALIEKRPVSQQRRRSLVEAFNRRVRALQRGVLDWTQFNSWLGQRQRVISPQTRKGNPTAAEPRLSLTEPKGLWRRNTRVI